MNADLTSRCRFTPRKTSTRIYGRIQTYLVAMFLRVIPWQYLATNFQEI